MFDIIAIVLFVVTLIKGRMPVSRSHHIPAGRSRTLAIVCLVLLAVCYSTGKPGMHALGVLGIYCIVAVCSMKRNLSPVEEARENLANLAADSLRKATKLEARGHIDDALSLYNQIISDYPGTPTASDAQIALQALKKRMEA